MKKYDVNVRTIKENTISVFATCRSEAISKVEELVASSCIKDIDIRGITRHYVTFNVLKKSLFKRKYM